MGSIVGRVSDPTGGVVAGAQVTAMQAGTGQDRRTVIPGDDP